VDSRIGTDLSVCEFAKLIALFFYALFETGCITSVVVADALSLAAILSAMVITIAMILLARELLLGQPSRLTELRTNKFLALMAVIVAFLHVTYCLTFALAFSDRFGKNHDLYATKEGIEPKPAGDAKRDEQATRDRQRIRKFFFVESAATLACTKALFDAAEHDPALGNAVSENETASRIAAFDNVSATACGPRADDNLLRRAAVWNLRALDPLRRVFKQMVEPATAGSHLIEIRGHANDTRIKSDAVLAYGSNYEISKQRADQVALFLGEVAERDSGGRTSPAVRWLAYGVSNEPSFLDGHSHDWVDAKPLDMKLSVEVRIVDVSDSFGDSHLRAAHVERRDLELLDYLYFMVYTITTTGYGDITPTSSYAKSLVTLANLIEVLFVVVLVNLIANAPAPPKPTGEEHESSS
jgi:hypothetical protein